MDVNGEIIGYMGEGYDYRLCEGYEYTYNGWRKKKTVIMLKFIVEPYANAMM